MEKCKFCGAELEEEVTLCPACGKDNADERLEETATEEIEAPEAEQSIEDITDYVLDEKEVPQQKATPKKIALSVIAIVVLLAIIAGLLITGMKPAAQAPADTTADAFQGTVPADATAEAFQGTVPADGNPEDVTCKGSYSAADEDAAASAQTVVATMGEHTLTNAQLQVYYWNYVYSYLNSENAYMQIMTGALDLGQPLDAQVCGEDSTVTWQQYFLRCALENWQFMQALAIEGEEAGYSVSEENLTALEQTPSALEDAAVQNGMASAQELLVSQFGAGTTMDAYMHFENLYYRSIPYYYDETAKLTVTEAEIEAFFNEHEAEYAELGLLRTDTMVDVRHILIMPEGATNETIRTETFPEEAWTASEARAQEILQEYLDGELTEERFGELANTYTEDGNDSNYDGIPDGGLYTGVTKGQMVPEFEDWCFDEARVTGDTGIVKTDYGYHIMYFVKGELLWPQYAEQDALAMKGNELITGAVERHPVEVDYAAIAIANVVIN